MTARVLMSWSSGKDSAYALHVLRREAHPIPVTAGVVVERDGFVFADFR